MEKISHISSLRDNNKKKKTLNDFIYYVSCFNFCYMKAMKAIRFAFMQKFAKSLNFMHSIFHVFNIIANSINERKNTPRT